VNSCKTCGAAFTATGRNQRYCSPACRPSKRAAYPDGRRACAKCGTLFTRTSYAQRYCSLACRESEAPGYKQRKYVEHVGRPLKPRGAKPDLAKRAKVAALREAGWTLKRIGDEMGVTQQAVCLMLAKLKAESEASG